MRIFQTNRLSETGIRLVGLLGFLLVGLNTAAQYDFVEKAPASDRIRVVWQYCATNLLSDKDSLTITRFFEGINRVADSAGDKTLKAYTRYFQHCSRILFSENFEKHFAPNDYQSVVRIFAEAGKEGAAQGFDDIAVSADHYIGQVYFRANLYGQAFEYLLKAHNRMQQIGYGHIPPASVYLYDLGLDYYRFEDYDKALTCFLNAIRYPVYVPRNELSSLNAIGLIYTKQKDWENAIAYFHKTIDRANTYHDDSWVGIASGNLGSIYLAKGSYAQALAYYRINYRINGHIHSVGRSDAALCAMYMAKAFAGSGAVDSAVFYLQAGLGLSRFSNMDKPEWLNFYKNYYEAGIAIHKQKNNHARALELADSLLVLNDSIHKRLDSRILNRAVQKTEAERNLAQLQLLESRKNISQLRLLLVIGGLVALLAVMLLMFRNIRRRKREQDALAQKEKQLLSVEKLRAEESLQHAQNQLNSYLHTIREKNDYIELLATEMSLLKDGANDHPPQPPATLQLLLSKTILTDADWLHFRGLFEQVHPGFTERLFTRFPQLSPAESRLLILSRLDLSGRDIANMLGVSVDAIRKLRYRLRKKLDLAEEVDFGAVMREV